MSTAIILQIDKILRTERSFAFWYSTKIHDTLLPAYSIQEILQRPLARHGHSYNPSTSLFTRNKIPLTNHCKNIKCSKLSNFSITPEEKKKTKKKHKLLFSFSKSFYTLICRELNLTSFSSSIILNLWMFIGCN